MWSKFINTIGVTFWIIAYVVMILLFWIVCGLHWLFGGKPIDWEIPDQETNEIEYNKITKKDGLEN